MPLYYYKVHNIIALMPPLGVAFWLSLAADLFNAQSFLLRVFNKIRVGDVRRTHDNLRNISQMIIVDIFFTVFSHFITYELLSD